MKRGPKPRQVAQDLLEQIEHHAARGLSQKQICKKTGNGAKKEAFVSADLNSVDL